MSISKMNVKTTVKHSCLHCLDANHWLCKFSPLPFSCCTAFALEVLRVDLCCGPGDSCDADPGSNPRRDFPSDWCHDWESISRPFLTLTGEPGNFDIQNEVDINFDIQNEVDIHSSPRHPPKLKRGACMPVLRVFAMTDIHFTPISRYAFQFFL
jgi:hypothetical protein